MSFDFKIESGGVKIVDGELQIVEDSEKLIQDLLKICLTEAGSNYLNPWYGSYLSKTVIGLAEDPKIIIPLAKSQLTKAIENLKKLQDNQIKNFQRLSADEQIASIKSIDIFQDSIKPGLYNINITVISKGYKAITARFALSTI